MDGLSIVLHWATAALPTIIMGKKQHCPHAPLRPM
jgi:hypothetical protein